MTQAESHDASSGDAATNRRITISAFCFVPESAELDPSHRFETLPGSTEAMQVEVDEREDEGPSSSSEDLQSAQQESLQLEVSAPAKELYVDKKAVDKLTEGFLSHYLPDLQTSKRALQELTQNQLVLLDTLDQEVTKFRECNALVDLSSLFTEAKVYHNKLVNIRKEMIMLHEKTTKLKKRALKLQQQKQREALEKEQQREKELERERQLIAKPAKRT
nr:PREDICTED: biogenesis of lysosome-related organelles complex 1 subunit 6 [Paralichthys olivaceus]XP_019955079.1 PREDICTED: biogenesis of lysosome-related organelles complex 1 subunit 6 [Paralichthys olivaceus]